MRDDCGLLLSQLRFGNLHALARSASPRYLAHRFRSTLSCHYARARAGPGEQKVRLISPTTHAVVSRTETGANVQDDFGYPCGTHRLNHLGPVLDHARLFVLGTHHIACGVLEKNDRQIRLITELNKLRHLIRTIGINRPIVANHRTGNAGNTDVGAQPSEPKGWEIEADPDVEAEVCRLTVEVGNQLELRRLDVCVDSGATFSMLSQRTYELIKHQTRWVSKLAPADRCLHGASGANLNIIGTVGIAFRLDGLVYISRMYVGNVVGVDALLGLPWLRKVGAIMNFGTMTIDLHPLHTVKLRTTHMVRHNVYVLTTSEEEPYSLCRQGLIPDTIHGYVQVVDTTTVEAGTSRMVKCIVTGRWEDGISAYFTASENIKYPDHVRVLDAIDKPIPTVRDGMRTQEIHVAIQNASLINFTIGKNTIVGNVEPLYKDTRPKRELPRGQRAGIYRLAIMSGKTRRSHWYEERLPEQQKQPCKAGPTVERNQAVKAGFG